MEKGKLVISLDFELIWGVFDKVDPEEKRGYFKNTRQVIPRILDLFNQYQISCTWATVGMLFHRNWEEWEAHRPPHEPRYHREQLSPYLFGEKMREKASEPLCFAPDLIMEITRTPLQELATHTYSHYYCSETGQDAQAFQADLEMALRLAKPLGVDIHSLVFPRNQLNDQYLGICASLGIQTVRINPENWYWLETEKPAVLKKIFRTGDAYAGPRDKSYSPKELVRREGFPLEQKASRLLRPHSGIRSLDRLRISRIRSEMLLAAKRAEIYHLWWHPHNFGNHTEKSLEELRELLDYFLRLKEQYGFESVSMKHLAAKMERSNRII